METPSEEAANNTAASSHAEHACNSDSFLTRVIRCSATGLDLETQFNGKGGICVPKRGPMGSSGGKFENLISNEFNN